LGFFYIARISKMNNGLHLKELVLRAYKVLVELIDNKNDGAFGCVWSWMLLGNKWGVFGVCWGKKLMLHIRQSSLKN
jgi:hypothetical protein